MKKLDRNSDWYQEHILYRPNELKVYTFLNMLIREKRYETAEKCLDYLCYYGKIDSSTKYHIRDYIYRCRQLDKLRFVNKLFKKAIQELGLDEFQRADLVFRVQSKCLYYTDKIESVKIYLHHMQPYESGKSWFERLMDGKCRQIGEELYLKDLGMKDIYTYSQCLDIMKIILNDFYKKYGVPIYYITKRGNKNEKY